MNCPYCGKHVPGMTGYQEAENFRKHLNRCGKTPAKVLAKSLNDRAGTGWEFHYDIHDALEIRARSGQ